MMMKEAKFRTRISLALMMNHGLSTDRVFQAFNFSGNETKEDSLSCLSPFAFSVLILINQSVSA